MYVYCCPSRQALRHATHPTPDHLDRPESSDNEKGPRKQNLSNNGVRYCSSDRLFLESIVFSEKFRGRSFISPMGV